MNEIVDEVTIMLSLIIYSSTRNINKFYRRVHVNVLIKDDKYIVRDFQLFRMNKTFSLSEIN